MLPAYNFSQQLIFLFGDTENILNYSMKEQRFFKNNVRSLPQYFSFFFKKKNNNFVSEEISKLR